MKRRAAVEPVIGHLKAEHRRDRNYLKGVPATAPMPCWPPPVITLLLRWLARLLRALFQVLLAPSLYPEFG
jgi:transposase, IS5 family